jgi:hypothetical protein
VAYVSLPIFLVHLRKGMCYNVYYLKECMWWCMECSIFIFFNYIHYIDPNCVSLYWKFLLKMSNLSK